MAVTLLTAVDPVVLAQDAAAVAVAHADVAVAADAGELPRQPLFLHSNAMRYKKEICLKVMF